MTTMVCVAVLGFVAVTATAQQDQAAAAGLSWRLKLGVSQRNFGAVDYDRVEFRNFGGQTRPAGGPYGVQNVANPGAVAGGDGLPGLPVALDYVSWPGGRDSVAGADQYAPVIGFATDLGQYNNWSFDLVGNLQLYHVTDSYRASGTITSPGGFATAQYTHLLFDIDGDADDGDLGDVDVIILPAAAGPEANPAAGTIFGIRNLFDMDLLVLDLGLQARTAVRNVTLRLAAGPSLNLAVVRTEQQTMVKWLAQPPAIDADTYRDNVHDSDTDVLLGVYVAAGAGINITETCSIGVELRYDQVAGNAGTDQASLDLDGVSAQLKVVFQF